MGFLGSCQKFVIFHSCQVFKKHLGPQVVIKGVVYLTSPVEQASLMKTLMVDFFSFTGYERNDSCDLVDNRT